MQNAMSRKLLSARLALALVSITLLPGCSSELFETSASRYRVNSTNVYWDQHAIEGAAPDSFEVACIDESSVPWATDADNVYFRDLVIDDADPGSFRAFDEDWACDGQFLYCGRVRNRQVAESEIVRWPDS